MSEQAEYTYDVFISYSHSDKEWVWNKLLPGLEEAGLMVCIDARDFEPGLPSLVNMENAAERSRKTLIVLTPAWVKSEWATFESLLIQTDDPAGRRARMIPLRLKPCKPPKRIGLLTYVDFTQPEQWENRLHRLITSIKPEPKGEARERRLRGRIPTPDGPLMEILRDPVFRGIGAIIAVLALVAVGTWFGPDIRTLLFPPTPTATPTSTVTVMNLTDARVRFNITFSNGKLQVPPGGTLSLMPGDGILIETSITIGQLSFPRDLTYQYLAPRGGIPEGFVGPRTSYVAPGQPGPDFITVLITDLETGNEILRSINVTIKEKPP